MNLKNKFPKFKSRAIGIKVRTMIIIKKKDKTFIMDNLSKKSFNRSILSSPLKTCKYVNNIYLFKSLVL